jgi:hypothetical protein
MSSTSGIARVCLAVSSWLLLIAVGVGYLTLIPAVDERLDTNIVAVRIAETFFLATIGAAAITAWISAVWYAITSHKAKTGLPRELLVILLIATNFVGAFFYYFLSVYWLTKSPKVEHGAT